MAAGPAAEFACDQEDSYVDPSVQSRGGEILHSLAPVSARALALATGSSPAMRARRVAGLPWSGSSSGLFELRSPSFTVIDGTTGEIAAGSGLPYYEARRAVVESGAAERVIVPEYELELMA
jgi:hypothetical protein